MPILVAISNYYDTPRSSTPNYPISPPELHPLCDCHLPGTRHLVRIHQLNVGFPLSLDSSKRKVRLVVLLAKADARMANRHENNTQRDHGSFENHIIDFTSPDLSLETLDQFGNSESATRDHEYRGKRKCCM